MLPKVNKSLKNTIDRLCTSNTTLIRTMALKLNNSDNNEWTTEPPEDGEEIKVIEIIVLGQKETICPGSGKNRHFLP